MKNLSEKARKLKNKYQREYRNQLSPETKEKMNEYQRKYRQRNPEKLRQYNINYWEKKAREGSPADQVKNLSSQGLTQREIAARLGISLGLVNKYLNN